MANHIDSNELVDVEAARAGNGRSPRPADALDWQQERERFLEAERFAAVRSVLDGMAHEIRNALQRSQACLEMLGREVENQPAAQALIARIQAAQNDLHLVYERVRDYASPLQLDLQRHSISSIVRQAWLDLASQRAGREARLREEYTGSDPYCDVDRQTIGHVFSHLLRNALAACAEPVEIAINYNDAELAGRPALQIVMGDNGPGLSHEEREKAFSAFHRKNVKGTGLGLAASKRIIEAHGGQIALGAHSGAGAQFILTLPRRKS